MLDLETRGKVPGCPIRSIGAVVFDPQDWSVWKEFYLNVTDTIGTPDAETDKWWTEQGADAQAIFTDASLPVMPLKEALASFREFFQYFACSEIWSHGAGFDVPIIEWSMRRCWVPVPWSFQKVRDTRTIYALANNIKPVAHKHYTIKHHALHDAANQANAVQEAFAQLGLLKKP